MIFIWLAQTFFPFTGGSRASRALSPQTFPALPQSSCALATAQIMRANRLILSLTAIISWELDIFWFSHRNDSRSITRLYIIYNYNIIYILIFYYILYIITIRGRTTVSTRGGSCRGRRRVWSIASVHRTIDCYQKFLRGNRTSGRPPCA